MYMFYTVYKITNMLDGKIYIGAHKTSKLDDDYMGGGKYLKRAQKKHGIENFEKEILEVFDNSEAMYEMESVLVTPEFITRKDTYNLKEGGKGGFDYLNNDYDDMVLRNINAGKLSSQKEAHKKIKWLIENDSVWFEKLNKKRTNLLNKRYKEGLSGSFNGKKHSEETKKKISKAKIGQCVGSANSQFGTMWVHSLAEKTSKKIKKEDFSDWEVKGWLRGRKMKFM